MAMTSQIARTASAKDEGCRVVERHREESLDTKGDNHNAKRSGGRTQ